MQGIPSYYGADDLMLNALYDEGCKICGNPPGPKAFDYPPDSFTHTSTKDKVKKGLKIGGAVIGAGALAALARKLFFKK